MRNLFDSVCVIRDHENSSQVSVPVISLFIKSQTFS